MGSLSKAKPSLKRIAIVIPYKDTPARLHEVLRDIEIILGSENFREPLNSFIFFGFFGLTILGSLSKIGNNLCDAATPS